MAATAAHQNAISTAAAAQPGISINIVADYLKSPDDLARLVSLRSKLHRESLTLEAKLKTGAKEQLEALRDGLLKLQATKRDVAGVRDAFSEVERLCKGSGEGDGQDSSSARAFRVISQVSQIHRNFAQTSTLLQQLEYMPPKIERLAQMLDEAQQDLFGPATTLLPLHYHLSQLETFRNETLQMARTCSNDVRQHLTDFFAPLDGLVRTFEEYLFALGERTLDLVRQDREAVVVTLVKIVEKESREDEKAAAIRLAKRANLEGAARFRSVIANARVIKLYRPKLLEVMDKATGELFEECWQRFVVDEPGARHLDILDHLDWVYKDLEIVKELVVPLFPPDYSVHRFLVKSYHKHLGNILRRRILATDPEASALLTLYQFTQEYTSTMTGELKVDREWLQPSLLDGKEQTIIDDYLALITRKIDEWTANLMSDEVRAFAARADAPEKDAEGLYGLNYAPILFDMLVQQCDLAAESNQGSVLAKAVAHATRAMLSTQATWLRVLESEFAKQVSAKNPEDIPPGLTEYVIALCNELIKSADMAEGFGKRFESLVSAKYKAAIREDVDNAVNGYLDVSARCGGILVSFVFEDLKPAVKELFTFPSWYAEGTCTVIIETMRDYLADYAELLNPNFFEARLLPDLTDRFLVSYLGSLRRTTKLRMPAAADRMKADIDEFRVMLSPWLKGGGGGDAEGGASSSEWDERAGILDLVLALLTSSPTMLFLPYWSFAKSCGPCFSFLEALMRARDDLDKADVAAIMESARRKVKNEALPDVPTRDGTPGSEPLHGASVMKRVEGAGGGGVGVSAAALGVAAGLLWGRVGGGGGGGGNAAPPSSAIPPAPSSAIPLPPASASVPYTAPGGGGGGGGGIPPLNSSVSASSFAPGAGAGAGDDARPASPYCGQGQAQAQGYGHERGHGQVPERGQGHGYSLSQSQSGQGGQGQGGQGGQGQGWGGALASAQSYLGGAKSGWR